MLVFIEILRKGNAFRWYRKQRKSQYTGWLKKTKTTEGGRMGRIVCTWRKWCINWFCKYRNLSVNCHATSPLSNPCTLLLRWVHRYLFTYIHLHNTYLHTYKPTNLHTFLPAYLSHLINVLIRLVISSPFFFLPLFWNNWRSGIVFQMTMIFPLLSWPSFPGK